MVTYTYEIVTNHGAKQRTWLGTLTDLRKFLCREIGKSSNEANIYRNNSGYAMKHIERIWYDKEFNNPYGNYAYSTAGYWIQNYEKHERRKLSAKTGKPMNVNKYWKAF